MPTVQYLVYIREPPKSFSGLLGPIQLNVVHLLLAGGKTLIEEDYSGSDPVGWYTECLQEQGIFVEASKVQSYKGQTVIWLQVDGQKTNVAEFTAWTELAENDAETLAWRSIWYPWSTETNQECLGLAVVAKEIPLQTGVKHPLTLNQVLTAILQ